MSRVKKQLEYEDIQPIQLNLIHGQYTSRKHKIPQGVITQPAVNKYFELREIQTPEGFVEKLVEVDYPITPDYVKSFANSTDYRNDLERAINEPARGANLGDLTGFQDITSMDMTAVREMQVKLKAYEKTLAEQSQNFVKKKEGEE